MEGATAQASLVRREWGTVTFAACAITVAIVAWPLASLAPSVGGDAEWVATLAYAAAHGIRFGTDLVWTYGPLGFLETPYGATLYWSGPLVAAWLYGVLVQLLLATTLLTAMRRALPLPVSALLAAAVLVLQLELGLALGFAWCVLLVLRSRGSQTTPAIPAALGVLTGILVLGKLNQGLELLGLAAVAVTARGVRRDALTFASACVASTALGWVATGQRVADAWPYVRNGAENVAGFAAAMGVEDPRRWTIVTGLALAALAIALAYDVGRDAPPRMRWGLLGLCLIYTGFNFKEGFVRQDGLHMLIFFADLLVLFAVLLACARRRLVLLAAMASTFVAYGAIMGGQHFVEALDPYGNVAAFADQLGTVASPARQHRLQADARLRITGYYGVAPRLIAAIGRRSVMMWPYAYGDLAYAYGLRLQPFLGLEPYNSYTSRIDGLGARTIASGHGPARILRSAASAVPPIDGRFATFEAPSATLQIFCRYRELASAQPWQVLTRAPNRCESPHPLSTVAARWGEPVPVPAPRRAAALVLVRVEGAGVQGLERLRELALRPQARWIALDGNRSRLVAATAIDGLLLSAPPRSDYAPPFAMAPNATSIAVGRDGGQPGGRLTYRFEEVPLRTIAPAARAP